MRIALDDVTVTLGGHRALDAVAADFAAGSVTAVIGPSGAGKSTLLDVIAGLVVPDGGEVRFDGEAVTRTPPEARRLGVVFQDLRLFDFLSGRDNVGFAPRVAAVSDDERRRRVDEALAQVHATGFADRPARVLSGGERQRIAIARALAARPRALLLDEPFASLDAELRRAIRDELGALMRGLGLTAVVVTHDRDDAFALASRLVVVRDGRVEQSGDAAELYQRPSSRYVATLLGEASFVPVDRGGDGSASLGGRRVTATGAGTHALLRPEALTLGSDGDGGWPARVLESRCGGGSWRTLLDAGALGRLVTHGPAATPGQSVSVRLPAQVHLV